MDEASDKERLKHNDGFFSILAIFGMYGGGQQNVDDASRPRVGNSRNF